MRITAEVRAADPSFNPDQDLNEGADSVPVAHDPIIEAADSWIADDIGAPIPAGVDPELVASAAAEYRESIRRQGGYGATQARAADDGWPDDAEVETRSKPFALTPADAKAPSVALVSGASLKPEPIRWLWDGWLARGKMHILGGAPGTGKTTLALALAAVVTGGGSWPDDTSAPLGNVVVWSGEDDPADTLAPRLIASGADMSRVFFVGDVMDGSKSRSFDPARDTEALRNAINAAGGAALLIVDPIVSAVAGDSHKNAEVRRALAPLCDLAASVDAALLGVTHFSKGTAGREPTERITGSLAFGALARVVLVAAKTGAEGDDNPHERIFMRAKSNIGADDGGFAYELEQVNLDAHPGVEASRIKWGKAIAGSARDVLGATEAPPPAGGGAIAQAATFLRAALAAGPMAAADVQEQAKGAGVSPASLRRAKDLLGIAARRTGFGGGGAWEWSLPPIGAQRCSIDAQPENLSTFGKDEHLWSGSQAVEVEI